MLVIFSKMNYGFETSLKLTSILRHWLFGNSIFKTLFLFVNNNSVSAYRERLVFRIQT